jgi:hypothetical protein
MEQHDNNGWDEWRNHVLAELKRFNETFDEHAKSDLQKHAELKDLIVSNKINNTAEITEIKTKVKVWGTLAGFLSGLATTIASLMFGK